MIRPCGKYGVGMWQYIMANLTEGRSMYRNCRMMGIQYHHKTMKDFERFGWLTLEKTGRERLVKFTERGREVNTACLKICEVAKSARKEK